MASRQRRARVRAALSTSSAARQSSTAHRKRTAIWRACAVLQASLLALSAAHAETRCTLLIDNDSWRAADAVVQTFGRDVARGIFPDTAGTPSTYETSCGTGSTEFLKSAGPFRVVDTRGEFDVTYYDQHKRIPERVNGQCTIRESTVSFPGLDANGNADSASDVMVCVTKLDIAGSFAQPVPPSCPSSGALAGNPILPATAEKYETELDFEDAGPAPLRFVRTYRSTWGSDPLRGTGTMGKAWAHNHGDSLQWTSTTVTVASAQGYKRTFTRTPGSSAWTTGDSADTLSESYTLLDRSDTVWTYRRADDDAVLRFDNTGRLLSVTARNGWVTTYMYQGWQLARITNPFGRDLILDHDVQGRLTRIGLPDYRSIYYSYDAVGRLVSVRYPDGKKRDYLYENLAFPHALTGVLDETGARVSSFAYDAQGRAIGTERALGVGRHQVSYPAAGAATVVDPLGTSRSFSYATAQGRLAVTGGSLPSATGEADAASRVQDANGLTTGETDFNGVTTTTTWDVARRLPLSVTHAVGTPEAQTVTTQWHPTFSLPVLVTESGRTTAYTYDDRGNVLSQAITDTASSPSTTRTWNWTWNAQGLAATETAPNGAVTTFEYDARGNLAKTTNALGHQFRYFYDGANRLAATVPPSNVVTNYTWDSRDRLLSNTYAGRQTYTATGLPQTRSLLGGLSYNYSYDAAHRLTGWSNNRGESGTFTLDAMGNRIGEQITDSTGAIAWTSTRTINSLNRLAAKTDGPNQTDTFGYDFNGERITETNGLNQSTRYGLDPLRRVKAITNAANASASLAYNALDAVTQASDFKGVATAYARDAQGNATAESSADIGNKSIQYDALGLPSSITDAMGQATQIQRDVLGRPTLITFADGKTTTLGYDATPNDIGYLSAIADRSGSTGYSRDILGRVTAKRQSLASGLVQQVGYTYRYNGRNLLASLSYPGGSVLGYQYDATGRLVQLDWNGSPLVTGIAWNPMGQPTAWNWAFVPGLAASRKYDTAGRMTGTEFASYVYDAAGRITSLTQNLFQPGDSDPTHSSIASANTTWNVSYDAVGRITGFNAAGSQTSFGYDANGNRNASTKTLNGQTTSRSYTVNGGSNRLDGFGQTTGGTSTHVAYAYNANGDLTSDGLRTYSYNAEGRLSAVTTGATDTSPTTRYAHNALGQRVFKTEPLYPPSEGDESDPGFFQGLLNFFTKLWGPSASDAEKLGFAFMYDEDGSLISETGTGGANSAGSTQYIYLPTGNGPMPIAAVIDGQLYAVHSDHLNTPRRLTDRQGQAVWQWAYSAFGDEEPTTAKNRFANLSITPNPGTTGISDMAYNIGFMGMYRDQESGLAQNWNRYFDKRLGRYTQPDRIGLGGGPNRYPYANLNPLMFMDPTGLMGVGSGVYGVPGSGASASGANGMVGGGFSVHLPLGLGIGIDGGVARDTAGNACVYSNVCYTIGPGMSGAIGLVGSTGSGLLSSGTTDYQGTCWTGGAGLTGSGSVLFGKDGSMSLGRGLAGPGAGASATYQACRLQLLCSKN